MFRGVHSAERDIEGAAVTTEPGQTHQSCTP